MNPSDIIRKVRRIEIQTRHLVTEAVAGAYHSSFKGRGMDFEEVREYSVGDDVRTIDWNVSARMDRPFVKLFREERELTLFLLVDLSSSGAFGSVDRSKREMAAEIACVLAFSATYNSDKVGLILYTDRIEHYIPPKKGRRHILRLIRDILYHEPKSEKTDHRVALNFLNKVQKRTAVTFLISDFLQDSDGKLPDFETAPEANPLLRIFRQNAKRHDLIPIHLSDPVESALPNIGLVTLEDSETGELVEIDTGDQRTRTRYAEAAVERRTQWKRAMQRLRMDTLEVSTTEPYLPALRQLFARRAKRL